MLVPSPVAFEPADRTRPSELTLLVVDGDRSREVIDRAGSDADLEFTVETVAGVAEIDEHLAAADCLVIAPSTATEDDGSQDGDDIAALADRLETVRAAAPDLPVVVLVSERTPELADAVRSDDWTAVIERADASDWFVDRVRDLLERHRLAALSRRSLASVELAGDAIAFVDPAGEIQFASRQFAMQFGYDPDALHGTPWRALFSDDAVDHLESAAIPTVAEGWRWAGSCTGRRKTGATFPTRVRLGGLEDGSLLFGIESDTEDDGFESPRAR